MSQNPDQEYQEFGVFTGPEKYQKCLRKEFLIEHFLYEKDVLCISADPGIGKSILALQIMGSLTTGLPFLDTFEVKRPCNVLYLQTEGDRAETIDRIIQMKKGVSFDDEKWVHLNLAGVCLNVPKELKKFVGLARMPGLQYDVIIIDPLYTTVKGSLSNDEVVTDWIRCVREVRKEFGCSILVLHHEPKEIYQEGRVIVKRRDSIFGSVFWAAFFDHNFKLVKTNEGKHFLYVGKQRTGKIVDVIEMKLLEPSPLMYIPTEDNTSIAEIQIEKLLKEGDPMTVRNIIESTKLSKATVYRLLKRGYTRGIYKKTEKALGVFYGWTPKEK